MRLRRWLTPALVVLIMVCGVASVVDSPYVVRRSIEPRDAARLLVEPPLRDTGPVYFPVVDVHRARWIEVAWYGLTGKGELDRAGAQGDPRAEHGQLDADQLLRDSQQVAMLLAATEHGDAVRADGNGVRVWAVGRRANVTPLRSGDVIEAVNGRPVRTYAELARHVEGFPAGTEVVVTVRGRGTLPLGPVPPVAAKAGRLQVPIALGVAAVETDRPRVVEPKHEWRAPDRVGGTSAGLAAAIAAYERISGNDLAPGRELWATGEVGSDGGVYGVADVDIKARGAARDGADVLVVPIHDKDAARANADGVEVIAVSSFDEALAGLRRLDR